MNTNYRKLLDILERIKEIEDEHEDGVEDYLVEEGIRQQESGEYENSIVCYDKAIKMDPEFIWPWTEKGLTYWKSKKYEEAIACYDKANDLLKSGSHTVDFLEHVYHEIWNAKAGIFHHWGKYEEEIIYLDKLIGFHPEYPDHFSWNNKGDALNKLGKHEEAKECYDKANKIESAFLDSKKLSNV